MPSGFKGLKSDLDVTKSQKLIYNTKVLPQKNLSSQESEKSQNSEQNKILVTNNEKNHFDVPHFEDLPEIDGQEAD